MSLPRPIPGYAAVSVEYSFDGKFAENTFGLLTSGYDLADGTDVFDLASQIGTAWQTRFHSYMSSLVSCTGVKVQLYATTVEWEAVSGGGWTATGSGTDLSAQACGVVSWHISRIYRGGKPRIYMPGMLHDNVVSNREFSSAYVANMTTAAAAVLNDINAMTTANLATVEMGVLSRYLAGVVRTPPVFYGYTAASFQPRVCTQRGRLGREI